MHIDERLPREVEIGAVRIDSDFEDTEIVSTDGGREVRNIRTAGGRLRFEITYPHSQQGAVYLAVKAAYKAARGGLHSFDFQDHSEHTATDAIFGTGDGTTTAFPLYIPYEFGDEVHFRRIYRPVSAITIKKNGVTMVGGYSVNYDTGIVTFTSAPLAEAGETPADSLSWSGEFNIPVRFDSTFNTSMPATHLVHVESMVLQEVKL